MNDSTTRSAGALLKADGRAEFTVWAPYADEVELIVYTGTPQAYPMERAPCGYWLAHLADADLRYRYRLNGHERPDPRVAFPTGWCTWAFCPLRHRSIEHC